MRISVPLYNPTKPEPQLHTFPHCSITFMEVEHPFPRLQASVSYSLWMVCILSGWLLYFLVFECWIGIFLTLPCGGWLETSLTVVSGFFFRALSVFCRQHAVVLLGRPVQCLVFKSTGGFFTFSGHYHYQSVNLNYDFLLGPLLFSLYTTSG